MKYSHTLLFADMFLNSETVSNPEFLSIRINTTNAQGNLKNTHRDSVCDVKNEPAEADAVENRTMS